jgi:hypothetical protein
MDDAEGPAGGDGWELLGREKDFTTIPRDRHRGTSGHNPAGDHRGTSGHEGKQKTKRGRRERRKDEQVKRGKWIRNY